MLNVSASPRQISSFLFAKLAPLVATSLVLTAAWFGASTIHAQSGAPLAPTLIHSSVGTRASFAWAPNPQGPAPTVYFLQAGSGPGLSNLAIVQFDGSQTSFAVDAPSGVYYVRIVAATATGASAPSNEVVVTLTVTGCTPPGPPTGLIATPGLTSVTIRWSSPASGGPPTGYIIDVGSGSGLTNLGSFALPNSTTLTAPAPAAQYFARIRAINACGSSAPSTEVSFRVGPTGTLGPLPAGVYNGVMSGNVRPAPGRPPISSFQLTLNQQTPATNTQVSARWTDNAGCLRTNFIFAGPTLTGLSISVESLPCNDGDMILRVLSINGNVVSGTCNGGPSCTFSMTRQ